MFNEIMHYVAESFRINDSQIMHRKLANRNMQGAQERACRIIKQRLCKSGEGGGGTNT